MAAPIERKQSEILPASEKSLKPTIKVRKHLESLANSVEEVCPNLANFYRVKQIEDEGNGIKIQPIDGHCPYCNKPYKPGNYHTRLLPKPKLTSKIQKLLPRYSSNPRSLGKFHQKLVENYIEGQNVLITTCLTCKKKVKQKGQTRVERENEKTQSRQKILERRGDKEVKVLTAKEKKQEKKREKKKLMKQRRKDGNRDENAGLTLPSATTALPSPSASTVTLSPAAISTKGTHVEVENHTSSSELPPIPPVTNHKPGIETTSLEPTVSTSSPTKVSSKQQKHKQSSLDLNKVLAVKNMKHAKTSVASVITNKKKKKQLGQTLGLILKQEKNKSSGGSLSDFLSSL